jgi:DNA-binding response OmpR family regulator
MDSATAQAELDAVLPDVILLDWMLPGESGLSWPSAGVRIRGPKPFQSSC